MAAFHSKSSVAAVTLQATDSSLRETPRSQGLQCGLRCISSKRGGTAVAGLQGAGSGAAGEAGLKPRRSSWCPDRNLTWEDKAAQDKKDWARSGEGGNRPVSSSTEEIEEEGGWGCCLS